MSLQIALKFAKIWLTLVNPSSPDFTPKWHPLLIRPLAEWSEIVQWSQWREHIGKHHHSFEWMTPLPRPLPRMRVPNAPQVQLRDAYCHLVTMIEDIDKAAVCYARCHYEPIEQCRLLLLLSFWWGAACVRSVQRESRDWSTMSVPWSVPWSTRRQWLSAVNTQQLSTDRSYRYRLHLPQKTQ